MNPAPAQTSHSPSNGLRKELNLFDVAAIVVGTIIGSGIFVLPSYIAAEVNPLWAVMLVWGVGGVLSVFGALSLAELGAMYPASGGLCTYLLHAYGSTTAFLYAWSLLFVIHSGSIAALAVAFGIYARQFFAMTPVIERSVVASVILGLTIVSCLGIRGGKLIQNSIAVAKIGGLATVILLLGMKGSRPLHLSGASVDGIGRAFSFAGFGVALIAVLWAYEGWHVVSFVAGEMKRPRVDLPRGLLIGTAIVLLIYMTANLGYYHVLSPAEIRGTNAVAAFAVGKLFGSRAANLISLLVLISILGSINGMILSGPRVYYAMAQDGIFPRGFASIHERYRAPVFALIIQGIWAAGLAASGTYQQLFTYVIFTAWIFYGLAVGAVLVLRRTQPELERSYRVPGYPWICLLFCAAAASLVINSLVTQPRNSLIGIAVVASGLPLYFLFGRRNR
jgi:basic amino acid/polyamine antiporter, APA family